MKEKNTILIIDDNTDTINILYNAIAEKITTNILCCTDVENGLRLCLTNTPDLVIYKTNKKTDQAKRLSKIIKKNNETSNTVFLLICSEDNSDLKCSGVDLYMKCPVDPTHLVTTVVTLLRLKDLDDLFNRCPKMEDASNIFHLKRMMHDKLPERIEVLEL